jgi:hypothetical protein
MNAYIVTYDFNKEPNDADRAKVREKIKSFGTWAKLSESCYAVYTTTDTAKAVYEYIRGSMDSNDYLFVVPIVGPYWGYGKKDVIDWMTGAIG